MIIKRINHLGIAAKDNEVAKHFFGTLLGLQSEGSETVTEQQVHVDFLQVENSRIELLTATTADSPITKFLLSKGSGIQHIALEVDNLEEWIAHLLENNVTMIDSKPRRGAHNTKIAFIHPKSTGGVLVELVEEHV